MSEQQRCAGESQGARKAQEMMQAILARSATDPDFRAQLLTDPAAAVEGHSGRPVRDDLDIRFVENEADLTIVLPDPVDPDAEVTDQELEAVAGGIPLAGYFLAYALIGTAAWAWDEFVEKDGDGCGS